MSARSIRSLLIVCLLGAVAHAQVGPTFQVAGTRCSANTINFTTGTCSPPTLTVTSGGGGGVTSVTCGTTMSCSPNPIVGTGTIDMATVGSAIASCGDASHTGVISVDAYGRTTGCVATSIAIATTAVTSGTFACAREPALTGDVASSAGSCGTTVGALQGNLVSNAAPSSNQVLQYIGTYPSGQWTPSTVSVTPTTLNQAYTASAGAVPSIRLTSGNGAITFYDNATPLAGDIFRVADSANATKYVEITDNGTQLFSSSQTPGATSPGFKFNTTGTYTLGYPVFEIDNNGSMVNQFTPAGIVFGAYNSSIITSQAASTGIGYSFTLNGSIGGASSGSTPGGLGGLITLQGGAGGNATGSANPGAGGSLVLYGGNAGTGGTGNANGGGLTIDSGVPQGSGTGSNIIIGQNYASSIGIGRAAITTTFAGGISAPISINSSLSANAAPSLATGYTWSVSSGSGGSATSGNAAGAGGSLSLSSGGGGAAFNAASSAAASGGTLGISAGSGGNGDVGGNNAGAIGGTLNITSGNGGSASGAANGGNGAPLNITAGSAGLNGNASGGSVTIDGGAKTGSGSSGNVIIGPTNAGLIQMKGPGQTWTIESQALPFNMTTNNGKHLVVLVTGAGPNTVTLPNQTAGRVVVIKEVATTGTVTVTAGSGTIEGAASPVTMDNGTFCQTVFGGTGSAGSGFPTGRCVARLISDGTNWYAF